MSNDLPQCSVERVQTGVRLERRTLGKIAALKEVYGLDLDAAASHSLIEAP